MPTRPKPKDIKRWSKDLHGVAMVFGDACLIHAAVGGEVEPTNADAYALSACNIVGRGYLTGNPVFEIGQEHRGQIYRICERCRPQLRTWYCCDCGDHHSMQVDAIDTAGCGANRSKGG